MKQETEIFVSVHEEDEQMEHCCETTVSTKGKKERAIRVCIGDCILNVDLKASSQLDLVGQGKRTVQRIMPPWIMKVKK